MKRGFLILLSIALFLIVGIVLINRKVESDRADMMRTKVALIMDGSRMDLSLCQSQYEAMERYREETGTEVVYHDNVQPDDTFPALIASLVEGGCNIFFLTSYMYDDYLQELSGTYPDVYFLNANGQIHGVNYSSFNGRMYQMRYLMGLIAGFQTETDEIGYVAAEPVTETLRQVNAFALGARAVNPDVTVRLCYTGDWNDEALAKDATTALLNAHDIDVLTLHTNTIAPLETADARGVYTIGNNYDNAVLFPTTYLTASIFDWKPFFAARISECERHKFTGRHYWEGVRNGMVTLSPLTGNVRFNARERVDKEMKRISEGSFDVFYGPVRDNTGKVRVYKYENLSDEYLLNGMDWLVEGVVEE